MPTGSASAAASGAMIPAPGRGPKKTSLGAGTSTTSSARTVVRTIPCRRFSIRWVNGKSGQTKTPGTGTGSPLTSGRKSGTSPRSASSACTTSTLTCFERAVSTENLASAA